MIGRLRGLLALKEPTHVLVDVHGVGFEAAVSLQTFYALPPAGDEVEVWTKLVPREGALDLFAFASTSERALFARLRTVSGIGPKLALTILSGMDGAQLTSALASSDSAALVAIPGVGRKTAERMIVELGDKIADEFDAAGAASGGVEGDAVAALLSLGYKRAEAGRAVRAAAEGGGATLEAVLKAALARLAS